MIELVVSGKGTCCNTEVPLNNTVGLYTIMTILHFAEV